MSPRDFRRVFQEAGRSADRFFTVLFRANGLSQPRLGLAISRKHFKRAVDRNRIKRVVRESFRTHRAALGGADIVVLSRGGVELSTKRELAASLEKHWENVHRRCSDSLT